MHDACIIFTYHNNDQLTQSHYDRFKYFNPEYPIVMIKHEDFQQLPYWDYDWMWGYNDNIWYRWFLSNEKILADRYFIFDYDTYCNDSIKNYYGGVWEEQCACSDHWSIQKYSNWSWFEKYAEHLKIYKDKLYGVSPPSSLMIRHNDMAQLIQEQQNNSIWRKVFLELRIGTILNINNVKISFIDEQKKHHSTAFPWCVPVNYNNTPGIYHPVKKLLIETNS